MRAIAIAQSEICTVIYGDHAAAARARQFVSVEAERDCARKREIVRKRNILIEIIVSVRKRAAFRRQRRPTVMICMLLGGKSAFGGGGERRHPNASANAHSAAKTNKSTLFLVRKVPICSSKTCIFTAKPLCTAAANSFFPQTKRQTALNQEHSLPENTASFQGSGLPPSEYSLYCQYHASFLYSAANSHM